MSGLRVAGYGLIDRSRTLRFRFDGRAFAGHPGDTLAAALLAAGVRVVGRSFKYHRPRGLCGAWFEEPNALVDLQLDGASFPNVGAATTELVEGMEARAVNAWPSARFDLRRGFDLLHRFLGAGFYYKTFMWPGWSLYEPLIRRMAGMGRLRGDTPEGHVADQCHDRCDLLVIGAGAAGLAAARAAAEAGQDVVLVDDHPQPGGGLWAMGGQVEGRDVADWIGAEEAAIRAAGGRVLLRTTAFGVYDHGLVALAESRGAGPGRVLRLWRMRARRVVLATGALDRPITFAQNDLPGILPLWAAEEYLGRYGVLAGRELVVLSNHALAEASCARLEVAGARVTRLEAAGARLRAIGGRGRGGIGGRGLRAIEHDGTRYRCDALLVSGGLTPLVHLWRHAGGKLRWDAARDAYLPGKAPEGMRAAGAVNGAYDLEQALEEGRAAGLGRASEAAPAGGFRPAPLSPDPAGGGRQWIDFQHDVTLKDIEIAARENFTSVEHLKRYTTLGMAADQGKSANMAGLAAMAALRGRPIPEIGTTTFRPPFVPVPLALFQGARGGRRLHPLKRLPLEAAHREAGAALGEYGGWLRPAWYGQGPAEAAIAAEALAARRAAGILDASPLGKIEVMGPEAEAFVNFVFYNDMASLAPGRLRYGFLLSEQGVVLDDAVVARLGPERFVISCSSGHVDGVTRMLESWRQDVHDPERVFIHDTTRNWPTLSVAGPRAREIVAALGLGVALGAEEFPHMSLRMGAFRGAPVRIARASFTGDLGYELTTTRQAIGALWQAALAAGAGRGAVPLGLEALSLLRAEKGHVIVGKDTTGETMPHDLGFTAARARKKAAYVGDRGLRSEAANDPRRLQLVGLEVAPGEAPLEVGAHLLARRGADGGAGGAGGGQEASQGFVTSSYRSPFLNRPIALALLEAGRARLGESVTVWHMGARRRARVSAPDFLDPEGKRLHA